MKVSAVMSVKPPPLVRPVRAARFRPIGQRLMDFLLADWWIDVLLMLFIVFSMLFLHH